MTTEPESPRRLDLAGKLRQPEIASVITGMVREPSRIHPIVVEVDLTTACNLRCSGCISEPLLGQHSIADAELDALVSDIQQSSTRAVVFSGGGEPTAHPRLGEVIESLCDAGVSVGLVTNGLLLERIPAASLARLAWLRFSVDAATSDTYRLARPGPGNALRRWEHLLANINNATSAHSGSIGASFVLHDKAISSFGNVNEMRPFSTLMTSIGVDYVEYKAFMHPDHQVAKYSAGTIERALVELAEIEANDSCEIAVAENLKCALRGNLRQEKDYDSCPSALLRRMVTPSGVFPCSYHRGNEELRLSINPSDALTGTIAAEDADACTAEASLQLLLRSTRRESDTPRLEPDNRTLYATRIDTHY